VALYIEEGFEVMSVEAVASRAGTGKATIYRRWPSKEDLVIDAIAQVLAAAPTTDTGSVRDDLPLARSRAPRADEIQRDGQCVRQDGGGGGQALAPWSALRAAGDRPAPAAFRGAPPRD
jgi:AcrR family transcriptional regulator